MITTVGATVLLVQWLLASTAIKIGFFMLMKKQNVHLILLAALIHPPK